MVEWEDTLSQQQGWVKITLVINSIALEELAISEFDPVSCRNQYFHNIIKTEQQDTH